MTVKVVLTTSAFWILLALIAFYTHKVSIDRHRDQFFYLRQSVENTLGLSVSGTSSNFSSTQTIKSTNEEDWAKNYVDVTANDDSQQQLLKDESPSFVEEEKEQVEEWSEDEIQSGETKNESNNVKSYHYKHNQPYWAYKMDFMEKPENVKEKICYVHVGKTAGSTLACYLGFDYSHCATGPNTTYSVAIPSPQEIRKAYDILKEMIPAGKLANMTTSMIHRDSNSCAEHKPMSRYLFVVRNPYERIKSWFLYERVDTNTDPNNDDSYYIKKPLFIDCGFSTLNILGGDPNKGLAAHNKSLCSRRAFRAITGMVGYSAHNKFNYAYYYNQVLKMDPNPKISVIRMEHMERDWNAVELKVLGGRDVLPRNFTFSHKNKSPKHYDDMFIDETSKKNLCNALCEEIQVYKTILRQADNLDEIAYNKSVQELSVDCPEQANVNKCSDLSFI